MFLLTATLLIDASVLLLMLLFSLSVAGTETNLAGILLLLLEFTELPMPLLGFVVSDLLSGDLLTRLLPLPLSLLPDR